LDMLVVKLAVELQISESDQIHYIHE
jgi:hypothetical protein